MITNEKQYKITKAQAQKFLDAYNHFDPTAYKNQKVADELIEAQKEALLIQHKDLLKQIEEYESLKSGQVQFTKAHGLEELPKILIMSRIAQGITQADLAKRLNLKAQQIQRYEADMYASANFRRLNEIAKALGVEFKDGPEFILDTISEENWNQFPIREMLKRGWFEEFNGSLKQAQKNAKELLMEFFSHAGMNDSLSSVLHKKKARSGSRINQYALLAWQARIVQRAFFSPLESIFDIRNIDEEWVKGLVKLSANHEKGPILAKEYVQKAGIHLIFEKHLDGTHLDGVAMKGADSTPIIGMTLRYDRIDNFWFVLLHELGHIIKHLYVKGSTENEFIDENLDEGDEDPKECEANIFAQESLIPASLWQTSPVRFIADKATIIQQAKNWEISPAIIAGRILRETSEYSSSPELRTLQGENKVRHLFEDCV